MPFNAIAYAFKDKIPPLPCRVTVLPKLDADDLCDSEVNNSCKVAEEWVSFYEENGCWWARTRNPDHEYWLLRTFWYQENLEIPVKSKRSVSLSLEDLVNSKFSFYKARKEKSWDGFLVYNFSDYEETRYYELELITSPEELQANKQVRRRQRRESKIKEEERKELEQKKEAELETFVGAVSEAASNNFYDNLDQADSLSEAHVAQRHSMVQSLARELTQGQSGSIEHEVVADGYLSDDELDYDLTDSTGSGLDFGPTADRLPIVAPGEEIGTEANKEEVPSSPDALVEQLLRKQECARAFDKQERNLQRGFHVLLHEVDYLAEWQNIVSEDALAPCVQPRLQDFHAKLLMLPVALSDWETSLQVWG